ncbi:MAG TPA: hypothetical protein VHX18_04460 [Rhizomicrobium sp.]|jgi:hypothetical protein|nr:hypothetical protein [Rhizomicrobium sp.]
MIFARMFKFLVLPGQEQAYCDYLRDVVSPIDTAAHQADVFLELRTITPDGGADWNHGRIFTFRDRAQRDAFAARMAEQAAFFDGNSEATRLRKARAETMRRQVEVSDYQIEQGPCRQTITRAI